MSRAQSRAVAAPLIKLLVFAAVTLVLTGALATSLGSLDFAGGTRYRAQFTDVTGLLVGDDVRIAGVTVGHVTNIALAGEQHSVAEVTFTVDSGVPLTTGVLAAIRYRNLVGQRYVALSAGPGGPDRLPGGGLIPLSQTTPALDLTMVFNGFRPLFIGLNPDDINHLMYEIIQVLQGEGATLVTLLGKTGSLTTTLADRDAAIGQLITNLNVVLATLDQRDANLDQTIAQLQSFVSGLAADREAIGTAIEQLGGLTTVTASFLQDARPDLAQDVTLLDQLAGTLDNNSQVIDESLQGLPGRYAGLTSVAAAGSWFNFFLCDFDGRVGLPGVDAAKPTFSATAARCETGGTP
jgi:phospholipid/cholesterol/gamma-HCH transport system substrate-binding protein